MNKINAKIWIKNETEPVNAYINQYGLTMINPDNGMKEIYSISRISDIGITKVVPLEETIVEEE